MFGNIVSFPYPDYHIWYSEYYLDFTLFIVTYLCNFIIALFYSQILNYKYCRIFLSSECKVLDRNMAGIMYL